MQINYNIYQVTYCSVEVPKELYESVLIPIELKSYAVDSYARLKDGIEVNDDNLYELINSSDFNEIHPKWREFLKEVLEIKADTYIFHN